jgi:hypothetical protein
MADLERVNDEARPMLEEFLGAIGLHQVGCPLDFPGVVEPFSQWLDRQAISEEDRLYLAARLGAFICEYLIELHGGERFIESGRILMRLPIQKGILREFDPYAVAVELTRKRNSLKAFLDALR